MNNLETIKPTPEEGLEVEQGVGAKIDELFNVEEKGKELEELEITIEGLHEKVGGQAWNIETDQLPEAASQAEKFLSLAHLIPEIGVRQYLKTFAQDIVDIKNGTGEKKATK